MTRLQLQDLENGELILLDVSARDGKAALEPVRLVYSGKSRRRAPAIREPCQGVTPAVKGKRRGWSRRSKALRAFTGTADALRGAASVCPAAHGGGRARYFSCLP